MKPLAILLLVSVSLAGYSQTQTPEKEFVIVLSQDNVEISGSESKEVEIKILRSKAYLKSSAVMGLSSALPKGIEVTFSPEKGNFENTKVIIKSSEVVAPGQYSLIVNATLNGRTKGSIIKLNVIDKVIASDGKQ
ncbi:MAG TPA: hypothetical protein VK589_00135 [Chryseolinea sp.]|nr:hypothetical protein [Chryseolinea sp.]